MDQFQLNKAKKLQSRRQRSIHQRTPKDTTQKTKQPSGVLISSTLINACIRLLPQNITFEDLYNYLISISEQLTF